MTKQKLVDLHPSWIATGGGRHGMGITFDCPVHGDHKLGVPFVNPIDGGEPCPNVDKGRLWHRDGETFGPLSLTPSLWVRCKDKSTDWHGHITEGKVG